MLRWAGSAAKSSLSSAALCPLLPEFILLPAPSQNIFLPGLHSCFNTMRKSGGVSWGQLESFWWVSKASSGLSDSFSQTTPLAQGREVDVPVLGRERHSRHRVTKLGLLHLLQSLGLEQKVFIN